MRSACSAGTSRFLTRVSTGRTDIANYVTQTGRSVTGSVALATSAVLLAVVAHGGEQASDVDGLANVKIGRGGGGARARRRYNDDRHVGTDGLRASRLEELPAVHDRHHQIQHDHARM